MAMRMHLLCILVLYVGMDAASDPLPQQVAPKTPSWAAECIAKLTACASRESSPMTSGEGSTERRMDCPAWGALHKQLLQLGGVTGDRELSRRWIRGGGMGVDTDSRLTRVSESLRVHNPQAPAVGARDERGGAGSAQGSRWSSIGGTREDSGVKSTSSRPAEGCDRWRLRGAPPPVDGEGHISADVKIIDRFQVVQLLDRGTFGTVFRAWDPKWRQFVALKVRGHFTENGCLDEGVRKCLPECCHHKEMLSPLYVYMFIRVKSVYMSMYIYTLS